MKNLISAVEETLPIRDVSRVCDRLAWAMRDVPFPPDPIPLHPIVLSRSVYDELHDSAIRVVQMLKKIAYHLGRSPLERMSALKIDPSSCPFFLEDEGWEWRYADCIARPDVILTPGGLKFIECNAGGGVGSVVQTQLLADAWVDDIYRDQRLAAHRPFAARADMFDNMAARESVDRSVALFGSVRDLARGVRHTRYFDVEVEYLRGRGFAADFFEPQEFLQGIANGRDRSRYALGLRHFSIQEWVELGLDFSPVGEALAAGCQLVASQSSRFLFNKKLIGLASEGQPCMSEEDHQVADRYLPWTRVTGDREVWYLGSRYALPELLVSQQDRFVLKGAAGMKGEAVLLGRDTSEADWREAVAEAVRKEDSVAQERQESVRFLASARYDDGTVRTTPVAAILGPNIIGGRAGGCLVRYHTDGSDGVVSVEAHGGAQNIAVIST